MRLLDKSDIEQIQNLKRLLTNYNMNRYDDVYYEDDYKINAYMCRQKLVLIMMERLFKKFGLECYNNLNIFKNLLRVKADFISYNYEEYTYSLSECIHDFYMHYMSQLDYTYEEIDIVDVLEQVKDDKYDDTIMDEYDISTECMDAIISLKNEIGVIYEGSIYIWRNRRIEELTKKFEIILHDADFCGLAANVTVTPLLVLSLDCDLPNEVSKGVFTFSYMLYKDVNEDYLMSVTGFDINILSILDAVLLHDMVMKLEQKIETDPAAIKVSC